MLEPAVIQHATHQGRAGAGHGDGNAVSDAEQHDEENTGSDLLLDGDDGQDRRDESEGAGAGKNPVGQAQQKRTAQASHTKPGH